MTRGSTGLVGQNTSCKVHKVCISLWPTGWDGVNLVLFSRSWGRGERDPGNEVGMA